MVTYVVTTDWATGAGTTRGFTGDVTIKNTGTASISNWTLTWTYAGNQTVTSSWNSTYTQSGQNVSFANTWNGNLAPNGSANFGFNATYIGTNTNPASFKVNGVSCS